MSATLLWQTILHRKLPVPYYQRSAISNNNERLNCKTISYHTISSSKEFDEGSRLNWKVTPFKDYYTFDMQGYSGFGGPVSDRLKLMGVTPSQVTARAHKFLEKVPEPKYVVANSAPSRIQKLILVGQLSNDSVAKLRLLNDEQTLSACLQVAAKLNLPLYQRPHPYGSPIDGLPVDQSDFSQIHRDSIVICHNSGFGINAVANGLKTVFLAPNEFNDEQPIDPAGNVVDQLISRINEFSKEKYYPYFASIVTHGDSAEIKNVVKNFLAA